jgi:hypothetical protein
VTADPAPGRHSMARRVTLSDFRQTTGRAPATLVV